MKADIVLLPTEKHEGEFIYVLVDFNKITSDLKHNDIVLDEYGNLIKFDDSLSNKCFRRVYGCTSEKFNLFIVHKNVIDVLLNNKITQVFCYNDSRINDSLYSGYKVNRFLTIKQNTSLFSKNIGSSIKMVDGSLFKSGLEVNTIKDVIVHPNLKKPAYKFLEDNSYVDCSKCYIHL